jgi:DNA mismatch endonuclease (patch repair protein)
MDSRSISARSENMRRIRSRNTLPEMVVRSMVHALGYRFRLHQGNLPGRPDIVFPSRKRVIFVHGCFWHAHRGCARTHVPKTNDAYWVPKLAGNKDRDRRNRRELATSGWRSLVIWECEIQNRGRLIGKLTKFLGPTKGR